MAINSGAKYFALTKDKGIFLFISSFSFFLSKYRQSPKRLITSGLYPTMDFAVDWLS